MDPVYISSIATIAIAIFTFLHVRKTRAMVDEMREARKEKQRPYIIIDLEPHKNPYFWDMVVKNVGNGAAFDLEIRTDAKVLSIIKNEIKFFPPGKEIRHFIGDWQQMSEKGGLGPHEVKLSYKDAFNENYHDTVVLDLRVYENLHYEITKDFTDIFKEMERLRRSAEQGVSEIRNILKLLKEGLYLRNYEFRVITEGADSKENARRKLLEFINLWRSYGKDEQKLAGSRSKGFMTNIYNVGQQLASFACSLQTSSSSFQERALKLASDIQELGNFRFMMDGGKSFERFNTLGDKLVDEARKLLEVSPD